MKTQNDSSVAETGRGQTLNPPIKYDFTWNEFETNDELVAAKEELTLDEQRKVRNTERKAKARSNALNAALDAAGIAKQTAENNDQIRLKDMLRTLLTAKGPDGAAKYTEQQARELAASVIGVDWATE